MHRDIYPSTIANELAQIVLDKSDNLPPELHFCPIYTRGDAELIDDRLFLDYRSPFATTDGRSSLTEGFSFAQQTTSQVFGIFNECHEPLAVMTLVSTPPSTLTCKEVFSGTR